SNVVTLHGRAEALERDPVHRARYDLVTARAVAKMETLAGWLLPLARPGGLAVAYKSRDTDAEIVEAERTIAACEVRVERIAEVVLPGTDILRKLVLLRKRGAGKESKP